MADPTGKVIRLFHQGQLPGRPYRYGSSSYLPRLQKRFGRHRPQDSDSGYLTRRLVDVAQDVIVRMMIAASTAAWLFRNPGRAQHY